MKNIYVIFTILTLFGKPSSGAPRVEVNSKVEHVVVFLNGAHVNRIADVSINKGENYFVFSGLPLQLDANSITVKGTGDFTILSVKHQLNYLKDENKPKEIVLLEDSLKSLNEKVEYERKMLMVYDEEEKMLIANKSIGGSDQGVKIAELKEAIEFFRVRLKNIMTQKLAINKSIKALEINIQKVSNQLGNLNNRMGSPTSEIVVTVLSNNKSNGGLSIKYYVQNASWTPSYDLRVNNITQPIELMYKANIIQSTGEDWGNTTLTLSTGNPLVSAEKPSIYPWYLDFYIPYPPAPLYKYKESARGATPMVADKMELEEAASVAEYTTTKESTTNINFNIEIPYNIPSDGKEYAVELQKYSLPAGYEYYCAPKLDNNAFLTAGVTKWEDLNLMSGMINIFFEDTYVGQSFLNSQNTNDTLSFSLGRDNNIAVTRTRLKDFSSEQLIGSNKKETRAWEINIRNKKKQPVTILVEDQFPVSANKEIIIERLDLTGGDYNETTGKISWKFNLQPSDSKKINLMYSVKYPKDKTLILE